MLCVSLVFALIASWYGFASDYSRYLHPDARPLEVSLFAGGGIACRRSRDWVRDRSKWCVLR